MASKFDIIRENIMENVSKLLSENLNEEVLQTGSNEICLPICNTEGDEGFLVITFKVPKGSRDGEVYDGYSVAEDYKIKCANKIAKAEEVKRKKEAKIARDAEIRRQKDEIKKRAKGE